MTSVRQHEQQLLQLQQRLNYQFTDNTFLKLAVTHRSYSSQSDNERLEFLGDSILGAVISQCMFHTFPDEDEGALTRLRARLVRGTTLTSVADDIQLGECLLLGEGERKTGGRRRASNLANAVEALFGAIYLDGGFVAAQTVIQELFQKRIDNLPSAESLKDPKTRLQEWLQANGLKLPEYRLVNQTGPDHAQTFSVECRIPQTAHQFNAQGSSRRRAEQAAAEMALVQMAAKHDG